MDFLVRTVTGRGQGESLETQYTGDALTLGSGGNSTVQLAALDGQVKLSPSGGGGAKLAASGVKATVAGKATRKAQLSVEDEFTIPGYRLQLFQPPTGFDLGLEIEAEGVGYAGSMDIAEQAISMRKASWIGVLLVLVLFLAFPLVSALLPGTAETLRESPLPDDDLWISGPLAGAHETAGIAQDCHACHKIPFVMSRDEECLACHKDMLEHVDIGIHGPEEFTDVRCATCHREHNEPGMLVRSDNAFCTDCHEDPERFSKAEGMAQVTRFTAEGHPEFRLGLLQPKGPGGAHGWETVQARMGDTDLVETSNLKFNHLVHLDAAKVQEKDSGEPLGCNSCHIAKDDGEHFEPITMNDHCRDCHSLTFDEKQPDVELPHGDLRAAVVAMEAHFIREYTDPELRRLRDGSQDKQRRTPRRGANTGMSGGACQGTGLECGRAAALREAQYQFAETGCVTCHEVEDWGEDNNILDRWIVYPVRITADWFEGSDFDHASHLSFESDDPDSVCKSCHAAQVSEVAGDILIPDRTNCLTCHDDTRGETSVTCTGCHAFHLPNGSLSVEARGLTGTDPHHPPQGSPGE